MSAGESVSAPVETAAAVVEAPVNPPEVVAPEADLSAKFAELKRQEKALRAEKHQTKSQIEQSRKEWESQFKADPINSLKNLGLSPDDIASLLLGQEVQPKQEDPTEELKKQVAELRKAREDEQVHLFKQTVFSPVESDPESFELILGSKGGKDAYWESVLTYFNTYGEAPDYKELANEVEAALVEDAKSYLSFKKLQPPKPVEVPVVAAEESKPQALSQSKTLSSELSPDAFGKVRVSKVDLSSARPAQSEYQRYMDELKAKALAKFS